MRFLALILCISTCAFLPTGASAQQGEGVQLHVGTGANAYWGDMSSSDPVSLRFSPSYIGAIQFGGKGWLQPRFSATFGQIEAQLDQGTLEIPASVSVASFVRTRFTAVDAQFMAVLRRKRQVNFLLGVGLGAIFYAPENLEGDFLASNPFSRLITEEYGAAAISFPVSVGVQTQVTQTLSFQLEYTYRPTQTDYLDNLGELGLRAGNDKIHAFSLRAVISFRNPQKASAQQQITPASPALSRRVSDTSVAPSTAPVATDLPETNTETKATEWIAKEDAALQARKFRYHRITETDTLAQLAEKYHVQEKTLRRINFLVGDALQVGGLLRIPDVR